MKRLSRRGIRRLVPRFGTVRATLLAALVLVAATAVPVFGTAAQTPSPFVEVDAGRDDAPVAVELPRDDGPHDVLIEWWYYTGHLFTAAGDRYGFEFVVFKGKRGEITGYASHFAVTDNAAQRFAYDQRLDAAPATPVAREGFDIEVAGWTMAGANGNDRLRAEMEGYAIDLSVRSEKPPTLHDGDGYIDYGSGQGSYYYSRTRMAVEGTLTVDGEPAPVTGEAWFDHQWGDFTTYEDGGWDWYALQLDDGTELMLYVIRAPDGAPLIVDGSYVETDGSFTVLDREDFTVTPTGSWTSARTGVAYPSGWRIAFPDEAIELDVTPSLREQELDTTASTGVIYWEGEVTVTGSRGGDPIAGLGYVELTGYANR